MAEEGCSEPPMFNLVTSTDTLRQKLWHAQQQGKLSDFQIKVNNVPIACHKVVLGEQCDYFSCMFQHENSLEVGQGVVDLKLLNAEAVKLVIGFIYSGGIEVKFHMIQEVLKVVNYFQLTDKILAEKISEYIVNNLCPENCLGWLEFGCQVNLETVQRKAESIMMERFYDVIKGSEFVGLTFIQLTNYMQQFVQRHNHHDQALQAFVIWVMHDAKNRAHVFEESLQVVDLNKCCASVLKDVDEKHGNVLLNSNLRYKFAAALSCAAFKPSYDVIVAGGNVEYDVAACNSSMRVLNLESGSIVEKASPNEHRMLAAVLCTHPDGVIGASGKPKSPTSDATVDCMLYKKNTNTWEVLAPFPYPPVCAGATCIRDELLMVIGGKGSKKKKVLCLDLKAKRFMTCRSMPQGMMSPIVGSIGKCVFVIYNKTNYEGDREGGTEISVQCYDTTTNSWTLKSPLPESIKATLGAKAVTIAGLLYLVGIRVCARYDPVSNHWTVLTPPIYIHIFGSALVVNNKIILSGGLSKHSEVSDNIEEYDPSTNKWKLLSTKLPIPLVNHSMSLG